MGLSRKLLVDYLTTMPVAQDCVECCYMMVDERLIGISMEGNGCDVIQGTIATFVWRDWGKSRKTSSVTAKINSAFWKIVSRNIDRYFSEYLHSVQVENSCVSLHKSVWYDTVICQKWKVCLFYIYNCLRLLFLLSIKLPVYDSLLLNSATAQ